MDFFIEDPRLSTAYLVENADDVDEAVEAVLEAEPRYYDSARGVAQFVTDVTENRDLVEDRQADLPLGQPRVIDLAE